MWSQSEPMIYSATESVKKLDDERYKKWLICCERNALTVVDSYLQKQNADHQPLCVILDSGVEIHRLPDRKLRMVGQGMSIECGEEEVEIREYRGKERTFALVIHDMMYIDITDAEAEMLIDAQPL